MAIRITSRVAVVVASVAALVTALLPAGAAQAAPGDTVLYVIDTSGSMSGTPLKQAKEALNVSVDALSASTRAGLRSYGGGCSDGGRLRAPVGTGNHAQLKGAANALTADGGTPTPAALRAAVGDLPRSGKRTIVLISDGQSTCGDPCPVARDIKNQLGVDFSMAVVGFNTSKAATTELQCVANATGGKYMSASNTEELSRALVGATRPELSASAVLDLVIKLVGLGFGSVAGSLGAS